MSRFENIKVAVAMATCNTDPQMLSQAIESVLNQTHKNLVFYIVNDSGNNITQIKKISDKRIFVIEHDEKLGLAQSMNEILDIAKEKYVFRMDADDISLPNRIEQQIEYMEENKCVDIASMFCEKIGSDRGLLYMMWSKPNDIKSLLLFTNTFIHSSVVFRNEFLQKKRMRYNPEFQAAQDYDMWNRCSEIANMSIIPSVGILYRVHDKQISSTRNNIQKQFVNVVRKANLKKMGQDEENFKYLEMLVENSLISDFNLFSDNIVKILNANRKCSLYNQKSLFNVISFFYLRSCLNTHNILNAIKLGKETRKMLFNPNNILVLLTKIKIHYLLNRSLRQFGCAEKKNKI